MTDVDRMGDIEHWANDFERAEANEKWAIYWREQAEELRERNAELAARLEASRSNLRGAVEAIDAAHQVILDALAWMDPEHGERLLATPPYRAFKDYLKRGQSE